jgi:tRNA pseudouridine38-40 synthase
MARYKLVLAYDGTEFSGMQRQARGRTVQGVVEEALSRLGWQGRALLCAGRTDAGVHASGQVAAFDLDWRHTPEDLLSALNALLPMDVAARAVTLARPRFHPRYHATARRYTYRLFCQPARDPLRERYAWRVWPAVRLAPMQNAARQIVGSHDFASFGRPHRKGGPTARDVLTAEWKQEGDTLTFTIEANAFLYHMVRHTVAMLVNVGQGRDDVERMRALLERPQSGGVRELAPAHGLELAEVRYPDESEPERT